MAIHMILAWVPLNAWRWVYAVFFQPSMARIPRPHSGADDREGRYMNLSSPEFRHTIKGFVDDDPGKVGTFFSPSVLDI